MKTIQPCDASVVCGSLVSWNADGLLTAYNGGDIAGVSGAPFELMLEGATATLVTELTIYGECVVLLADPMDSRGGVAYASGHQVSASVSGDIVGRVLPADFGGADGSFPAGSLVKFFVTRQ